MVPSADKCKNNSSYIPHVTICFTVYGFLSVSICIGICMGFGDTQTSAENFTVYCLLFLFIQGLTIKQ